MAGKKFGSDSPWSEISRLNLPKKSAQATEDLPDSATTVGKAAQAKAADTAVPEEKSITVAGKVATASSAKEILETDEEGVEVEENEELVQYTTDELQEMSLKELQAIAKEAGVDFKGLSKEELIDAITVETDLVVEAEEVLLSEDEELEDEEVDGEMSLEEALKLLGEDGETEEDFSDAEFEVVEEEVLEGDVNFEADGNN